MAFSPYIYGTTRLGDESIPFGERVRIAREAIEAGIWVHTSHQYGDALKVLRAAFDEDRANVPPAIFKIGWESPEQVREQILLQTEALGIEKMAVGQLCPGGKLAEDLRDGRAEGIRRLREEGLVDRFVLEAWPWTSEAVQGILANPANADLIDGPIFYLNPLQRFVTNELWDWLRERETSIVAMRTVAGGSLDRAANGPDYLRLRAEAVRPIFERSGCADWTEFCARFALGYPQVQATVGSTARSEALRDFLRAAENPQPLSPDVVADIERLQREWSDAHDRDAAPWSM